MIIERAFDALHFSFNCYRSITFRRQCRLVSESQHMSEYIATVEEIWHSESRSSALPQPQLVMRF